MVSKKYAMRDATRRWKVDDMSGIVDDRRSDAQVVDFSRSRGRGSRGCSAGADGCSCSDEQAADGRRM